MSKPEPKGNQPRGIDKWTVWDSERENAKHFSDRGPAEDRQAHVKQELGVETELFQPGELPEELYHGETHNDSEDSDSGVPCDKCGEGVTPGEAEFGPQNEPYHPDCLTPDSEGEPVDAEVIDTSPANPDTVAVDHPTTQPVEPDAGTDDRDLPDRSVADDPMTWIPGDFVDEIDGTQAINRKGFEVLGHFYDVDVTAELQVPPEETEHEYCRVKATATTNDGRTCEAFGSAHVDRGDDKTLLLEMAATRARKRALSIATGVGAVAVAELKNQAEKHNT